MRRVFFSIALVVMLLFFALIVRTNVSSTIDEPPLVVDQSTQQEIKTARFSPEKTYIDQVRIDEKVSKNPTLDETLPDDSEYKKQALFKKKNERIKIDDYGNYLVDISVLGAQSHEVIVSDWPIFFPSEAELLEGIKGCSTGGYYVDVDATLSLISSSEHKIQYFHYTCKVGIHDGEYYFKKNKPSSSVVASIKTISKTLSQYNN